MLEVIDNFTTEQENEELISYYNTNIDREFLTSDEIYNFKGVDIADYNSLSISSKLILSKPKVVRIQLVNDTFKTTDYFHSHRIPWSYVLFLSDNFYGGELIIENITIKPKTGQLLIFPGYLKHTVKPVAEGDRYTLVSFTYEKAIIKPSNLV